VDSMQAVETGELTGGQTVCGSPLCSVRFAPGGMPQSRKRFCSDRCLQEASLLRRAARLLKDMSDEKVLAVMRGQRSCYECYGYPADE